MKPNRRSNPFFRVTTLGFTAAVMAFSSPFGSAAPVYWDGGSGNWDDLTKWSTAAGATTPDPLTVPSSTESAVFDITTNNSVVSQTVYLNGGQLIGALTVNNSGRTTISGGISATPNTTDVLTSFGNVSVGVAAANKSMVTLQADLTALNLSVGGATTGAGAIYQSGGAVTLTDTTGGSGSASSDRIFSLGATGSTGTAGYGYYGMSGGTLTSKRLSIGARANGTTGVMEVSGASTSATSNTGLNIARGNGSGTNLGLLNVTGGTVTFAGTSAGALEMGYQAGDLAILNVGGGVDPAAVTQGTGSTATTAVGLSLATLNATGTNAVNLRTNGTLTVSTAFGATANATALINFNGGTLKATPINAGANFLSSANIDAVTVFSGGTIHNNGTAITVAKALAAPTGSGVQAITVGTQGAGYIGAPVVQITGGTGRVSTAVANMVDDGSGNGTFKVGSITATSPGDYSVIPTTVALIGGGPGTAATASIVTTGINTSGGMGFAGEGITTLSGASTYVGETSVSEGTLLLTGSLASNIVASSGSTVGGTGTTTGSLTMNGGSKLTSGTTGPLVVKGVTFNGAVQLVFNGIPVNGTPYDIINYGSGGVTNLGNLGSPTARVAITDVPASTKITATFTTGTRTWNTTSGTWQIGGAILNWAEGDKKFFNGDTAVFNNPAADSVITLDEPLAPASVTFANTTHSYELSGAGSIQGNAGLTKDGSGTLTIYTTNSYSGGTTINAGTLNAGAPSALGSGAVTVNGGILNVTEGSGLGSTAITVGNAGTLQFDLDASSTNTVALNSGGKLDIDGHNVSVGAVSGVAGSIVTSTAAGTGTLTIAAAAATTLDATLQDGAPGEVFALTKGGTGSLTLGSPSNSYSGPTIINGVQESPAIARGTIQIGANEVIPNTSEVVISNGGKLIIGVGTLTPGSYTETIKGLSGAASVLSVVEAFDAGSGGAGYIGNLIIDTAGGTYDFGGFVRDRGGSVMTLTKNGSGTQILSSTLNSFTGVTTINGGTLQLGNGTGDGTIFNTSGVVNNATLAYNWVADHTAAYIISGTGAVTKDGAGRLTLSAEPTYTGNTTIAAGTLSLTANSATTFGDASTVIIASGAVLDLANAATDVVGSLVLGGVAQGTGIYDSSTPGGYITGSGKIQVTGGGSAYSTWANSKGLTGANNGATQDPDFDGISNILEFVLNGDPLASDTGKLPISSQDASNFYFDFDRRDDSVAEVTLTFEYGTTLASWPSSVPIPSNNSLIVGPPVTVTDNGGGTHHLKVTVAKSGNTQLFGRLKAVK